ncbi:Otopetrin-2-like protein [Dinothrombium tinctorium]|uniref:Otopetrin-2-like protein n=1 Tax=Dinothrombium tinctorium TaxID=1965070 RepID=A0A3S3QFA7_9ACAR|nr:Otopetrin-2-like protein [Dinothrombium tinctorium]
MPFQTTASKFSQQAKNEKGISRQSSVVMSIPELEEANAEDDLVGMKPPEYYELTRMDQNKCEPENPSIRVKLNPGSDAIDGLVRILSAVYAKLIVITGLCFPMAEVISHRIPIAWYEGFYLFLYLGSILFLTVAYLSQKTLKCNFRAFLRFKSLFCWSTVENPESDMNSTASSLSDLDTSGPVHFGSFYLRLGAVAFGIGSMIYSGLEFGQYFELDHKEHCYTFLYGFTPTINMLFTFFQLYFIFMNSKAFIVKHHYIARVGLMHMIATNLCIWLHVLIQETKHQITMIMQPNTTSKTVPLYDLDSHDYDYDALLRSTSDQSTESIIHRHRRSIDDHEIYTTHGLCRRSYVIGQLVQDASQFLFPCTIEYSLICAAILYIMWKNAKPEKSNCNSGRFRHRSAASTSTVNHHHKHYYQVDCAKAHKGLFCGIFMLVVSIISLILFFVLIKKRNYRHLGVIQAHVVQLAVYTISAIACILAICQVRELKYNRNHNIELDNILLIVAQTGLYIFNMFSVIGAFFFLNKQPESSKLLLTNAIACLVQATLQSVFILDASRRYAATTSQFRRKPGRECVTFLLVCNFAMWAINTLETRKADSNPVQIKFYGFWAWTIITHVTAPLTIFFRFHSTVCLCDIWKRTYKLKINDVY